MKSLILSLSIALLGRAALCGQELPYTQKLYCNLTGTVDVETRKFPFGTRTVTEVETMSATGSFWVAEANNQKFLVTAAHNLCFGPKLRFDRIGSISLDPKHVLRALKIEPVLGTLTYEVAEVGIPQPESDWVVLKPADSAAVGMSKPIPLADKRLRLGDPVTVLGYPSTAHEKAVKTTVAAISPNDRFLVLNTPLDPGYSGGVVLNDKNKAVGIVVTSDEKQSNALILSPAIFTKLRWVPLKEISTRNF